MTKQEFLAQLRKGLSGLPQDDIEERSMFYNEMIDDRIEEGLSEEEAVLAAGAIDEIVAQAVADIPLAKIAKERIKPKRQLKVWEIILLALGSPIWLSLGFAVIAVMFSLYVVVWSLLISMWAVFASLVCCVPAGLIAGIRLACIGSILAGIAMLAVGIVCAGLSIFAYYGCKAATKGILQLTKRITLWIKNCFIKEEV